MGAFVYLDDRIVRTITDPGAGDLINLFDLTSYINQCISYLGGNTSNVSLPLTGTGSSSDPFTLTDGSSAGQVLTWNGSVWQAANAGAFSADNFTTADLNAAQARSHTFDSTLSIASVDAFTIKSENLALNSGLILDSAASSSLYSTDGTNSSLLTLGSNGNIDLASSTGIYTLSTPIATRLSTGTNYIIHRGSGGVLQEMHPNAVKVLTLTADPQDGVDTAYYIGQLAYNRINKKLFEVTVASPNPDTNSTGSEFKFLNDFSTNLKIVPAGDYSITEADFIVQKDAITSGGDTLTLPATSEAGKMNRMKDASGNAGTDNITIDTAGAALIDGAASVVLNVDFMSYSLYFDGTNYFTL